MRSKSLKLAFKEILSTPFWRRQARLDSARQGVLVLVLLNLTFNAILWFSVAFIYFAKIKSTSILLPLHFSILGGVDRLGRWYELFSFPGLGLFIFLLNSILAFLIYKKEKIISILVLAFSLIFQVLILIALSFLNSVI